MASLLAEGETVHLVVDSEFKRIPLPQKYLASFLKAAGKTEASGEWGARQNCGVQASDNWLQNLQLQLLSRLATRN